MAKEVNMLNKGSGLPNRKRLRRKAMGRSERASTGRAPGRWVKMVDGVLMGTYMKGRFVTVVGPAYENKNEWGWGPKQRG